VSQVRERSSAIVSNLLSMDICHYVI